MKNVINIIVASLISFVLGVYVCDVISIDYYGEHKEEFIKMCDRAVIARNKKRK